MRPLQAGHIEPEETLPNSLQHYARQFHLADLRAHRGFDDDAIERAAQDRLKYAEAVALAPTAGPADAAIKMAVLMRSRLEDQPQFYDAMQRSEFYIIAAVLADLVLMQMPEAAQP